MEEEFDESMDDYVTANTEAVREDKIQNIYNKMSDWAHDIYGTKTKPNFETWVNSLDAEELEIIFKIITKQIK